MTKKGKPTPPTKDNGVLSVVQRKDESADAAMARCMLEPETQAGLTIRQWQNPTLPESLGINETIAELKAQSKALKANSMDRAEAMLLSQAQTLESLFHLLATRAQRQEYLTQFEANLKLALKAQNQCRMTLETLSNIKNPPVVYAKQANIANGPQQINNGLPSTHTAENQNQQNQLLTVNHGETLDGGTTGETIGGDQAMEALEKQHRAANR
ncbi:hypothetical protein [Methylomonas rapida]|uniref:Uncharacterized protein n=1 Tax=Methylomonas rapida TaxID=2963939 RepID=A0ABY7GJ08_9GAMM|nr:hypothetical protein [Methylomonas rapida]WAR44290.1 hypothetical protein NM686_018275 [Methylomonas rapida]